MSVKKVSVQWGDKKFDDIEIDVKEPVSVFQTQMYSLTMVPNERQKIMIPRKGQLKGESWGKYKIRKGMTLMFIGTPDENMVKKPEVLPSFIEDMTDEERGLINVAGHGAGLANLGNTCYLNSSIQVLGRIDELLEALKTHDGGATNNVSTGAMTNSLKELLVTMDNSSDPIPPFHFLSLFKSLFPQFASVDGAGRPEQQDAEECYSVLMRALSSIPIKKLGDKEIDGKIEDLFKISFVNKLVCAENPEEVNTVDETANKLTCHITSSTNYVTEGILAPESIEKTSTTLGRNAVFNKTIKIDCLPRWLNLQFVRFWWNPTAGIRTKINRPVKFPLKLDLFEFCSERLQNKLSGNRKRMLAAELNQDAKVESADSMDQTEEAPTFSEFENDTGMYELTGVITHRGRTADGGHYVAWIKQAENKWLLYDDDKVSHKTDDDIKKLSGAGGADWHIAYICLYRSIAFKELSAEGGKEEAESA